MIVVLPPVLDAPLGILARGGDGGASDRPPLPAPVGAAVGAGENLDFETLLV
jgi:hypothetical protein